MIYDFLIIGGGISGASAGFELAAHGSAIIVEGESVPGFHSTGRSAALYTPNYGPDLVRLLNQQSYNFYSSPPEGFSANSLLSPRGMMTVASQKQVAEFKLKMRERTPGIEEIDAQEVLEKAPFLKLNQVIGGAYEQGVFDMDVNAIHQGFLKGFSARGGKLLVESLVTSMRRVNNHWIVTTGCQDIEARTVVNAAGAWADEIGRLAGAAKIGLVAKRRTAVLVDAPKDTDIKIVPAMDFMGSSNYIKPEKYQLMVSPGDEKPVPAQDIQPDDFDIAVLIDWLESTTQIEVTRVNHQWAGLRCFVNDGNPVVGFDPTVESFFWLAGQGGYGIMMAAALAEATATLITDRRLPSAFEDAGINAPCLSPRRLA